MKGNDAARHSSWARTLFLSLQFLQLAFCDQHGTIIAQSFYVRCLARLCSIGEQLQIYRRRAFQVIQLIVEAVTSIDRKCGGAIRFETGTTILDRNFQRRARWKVSGILADGRKVEDSAVNFDATESRRTFYTA